mgnify:CR=1 FL=1
MNRIEGLRKECLMKLAAAETILELYEESLPTIAKLRLRTKINILTHLLDYRTYSHFLNVEELNKYIENNINIILGFYEE